MLDPARCEEVSSTRLWTAVSWTSQFVLARPYLAIALLLLLLLWAWRWQSTQVKRVAIAFSLLSLLLYILIASPIMSVVGNRLLASAISPDTGATADAIVVLGRGPEQNRPRAQVAATLWQARRALLIFPSGRRDAPIMADLLRQAGVPERAISGDACSLTTEQNAEFTTAALWPEGVRKIILVTDVAHMLRSRLVFESFGFEVIEHVTPLAENTSSVEKSFLVVREGLGLLSYGAMGRYAAREIPR
ncbi:MAG: YdcF family protein [Cyanobacteria bacterium J06632_3]